MKTPIVVTGAAGFIGLNIVAALNARGLTNLVLVDRLGTDGQWRNLRGLEFEDVITPEAFLALVEAGCALPATRNRSRRWKRACASTCRPTWRGTSADRWIAMPSGAALCHQRRSLPRAGSRIPPKMRVRGRPLDRRQHL